MARARLPRAVRLAAAAATSAALLASPTAAAPDPDACAALLSAGAYETDAAGPHAALERVRRFLVAVPAESLARARATADALGVDARIFTLGVGGVSAASDWAAWQARLRQTDFSRLEMAPRLADVAEASSEALQVALGRCLEAPGVHLHLSSGDDPGRFTIHLRDGSSTGGAEIRVKTLTAREGPDGRSLTCAPELPVGRPWLGIGRPRTVPTPFESTCERTDLARAVTVELAAEAGDRRALLAPWQPPRAAPFERAVPALRCAQGGGGTDPVAIRATAACPSGERVALLDAWNERAEVACGGARAHAALTCRSAPDGVTTVALETGTSGPARVEGAARSALVVDLNAYHCLVVDAATGPAIALARPDRAALPLRAGLVALLDPPGDWPLVAEAPGGAASARASELRLRILQARDEGGCDDLESLAPARETTRSRGAN